MPPDPQACKTRRHVHVRGIVQGVGFRPFVYQLATSLELTGFVYNSSSGVTIEVEGGEAAIAEFVDRLERNPPQLAQIVELVVTQAAAVGGDGFKILQSREEAGEFSLVPPDAGTCDACWRDFGDSANRRFGYPFTNCTHCGPRYTIIEDIPYDRAKTTMSGFVMCEACQAEYEDPTDRRFHAQPNACAVCGPSVCLVPTGSSFDDCSFVQGNSLPAIRQARELLHDGKIIAVKGLGGFLLACDARNEAAVLELRRRKRRPAKPFALMAPDLQAIRSMCVVSSADEAALQHVRRSIVILPRRIGGTAADGDLDDAGRVGADQTAQDRSRDDQPAMRPVGLGHREPAMVDLPEAIAPGNRTLGFMLPYTPLHYLLFSDSPDEAPEFSALVMTSGNLSEEPIVVSNDHALERLSGVADWFLLHNRDIATRVDDSVVRTFEGRQRTLRRSRGYVPQTIDLGMELEQVLAVGADLKNTFCLTRGSHAILSQHIGDLENYETVQFFEETLAKMKHLFKSVPRAIAHDLHPGYRSTRMALASGIDHWFAVQHHHAHIASCMAENHLAGKVIGVAMDGTGLGTDGSIWGGEFLVADYAGFKRLGHLRTVPMPGGDAAVRQPWRMALSYLRDSFGSQIPHGIHCFREVQARQVELVDAMLSRGIQTVATSSCGRLFDAVAALVGLGGEVTFEGQAAIALEMTADCAIEGRYSFDLEEDVLDPSEPDRRRPMVVDFRQTIAAIVTDKLADRPVAEISACFHNTLSAAMGAVCCRIRESSGLDRVCLSGGVFQNHLLMERTVSELRRCGFKVFLHALVPANDGGISLGQAVIANELLGRGA